jgi:hypothetical protein
VVDALLLATALVCCTCGMAWLALSMKAHWRQVRGTPAPPRGTSRQLRWMGFAAVLASLLLCLRADHLSMAALVWVMSLIPAILIVAFTLAWRPSYLAWLVVWVQIPMKA